MLTIPIPGSGELRLVHLVCDFNGTLAQDGQLLEGIREVLAAAALGIAVVEGEGAAAATLASADVVVTSARGALELLRHPGRLVATLRD